MPHLKKVITVSGRFHFGVLMRTCVFSSITRGEFNVNEGRQPGATPNEEGYEVRPLHGRADDFTIFMTKDKAVGCTAPVDIAELHMQPTADIALYSERSVYVQNLKQLQAQIEQRRAAAEVNGSFDPYLDQIMIPRAELLVKLIDNMDEGFTHD